LNISFRDAIRANVLQAKAMGFYCVWGYNAFPLNSGNFASFKANCRSSATWMAANNIDEMIVGNEEDLNTGYTQSQLRTQLKDVCQTIKQTDGFPGTVSTSITTNVFSAWESDAANWTSFMKLDLHIYGELRQVFLIRM
jgi:exo-beta-1,3-glucanase (GH17 family)